MAQRFKAEQLKEMIRVLVREEIKDVVKATINEVLSAAAPPGRAFSAGAVIGRSFSVWFGNFVPFSIVTLLVSVPVFAIVALAPADSGSGLDALARVVSALANLVVTGALTYGVLQGLRGEAVPLGGLLRTGFAKLGSVLLVSIGFGLVVFLSFPQLGVGQDSEAQTEPAEPPIRPNHVVPAVDIVAFDFLLNRYGYHFLDRPTYDVSGRSIKQNIQSAWVVDNDPFDINQFLHPYQGAMYHGFARSAGLGYWESAGYSFAGSVAWEIAGEKTPPARNDAATR